MNSCNLRISSAVQRSLPSFIKLFCMFMMTFAILFSHLARLLSSNSVLRRYFRMAFKPFTEPGTARITSSSNVMLARISSSLSRQGSRAAVTGIASFGNLSLQLGQARQRLSHAYAWEGSTDTSTWWSTSLGVSVNRLSQ